MGFFFFFFFLPLGIAAVWKFTLENKKKQGVCDNVALPFTLKIILMQKMDLWKLKYFTMQKYKIQKIL
jgi:hypothetical protein